MNTSNERRCAQASPTVGETPAGSGRTVSLTDLFATITKVTGRSVPTTTAPLEQGDVTATLADTTLAADVLGWRARFPLAEGLNRQRGSLTTGSATATQAR